jgi:hypothetical protein
MRTRRLSCCVSWRRSRKSARRSAFARCAGRHLRAASQLTIARVSLRRRRRRKSGPPPSRQTLSCEATRCCTWPRTRRSTSSGAGTTTLCSRTRYLGLAAIENSRAFCSGPGRSRRAQARQALHQRHHPQRLPPQLPQALHEVKCNCLTIIVALLYCCDVPSSGASAQTETLIHLHRTRRRRRFSAPRERGPRSCP